MIGTSTHMPPDDVSLAQLPRAILDALMEGVQVVGFDWRYLYLNPAAASQGRRRPEELVGRTMQECYPGIEHTELFALLRRTMTERVPYQLDNEFRFPGGEGGWFELRIEPIAEGAIILSSEITRRKRVEEALRMSEAKYRSLFEHAQVGIFRASAEELALLDMNPRAARLLGGTREEILGSPLAVHWAAAAARHEIAAEVRGGGSVEGREIDVVTRRGEHRRCLLSATLLPGHHDVEATLVDITERKESEEIRHRLEAQLAQSQKMETVGRLAGGIAHDFNNLLSIILPNAEFALEAAEPGSTLHADLGAIRDAAERAANLTGQLLAFSRKQVMKPEVLDLNGIVTRLQGMLGRLLGEDIRLSTRLAADLGWVRVDPSQIEQVVMNLAVNARDAMPHGGSLSIETADIILDEAYTSQHPEVEPGHFVMLAVSDTGIGMDEHTRQHLFEPFFTTKATGKGTGLGLATVYGIVKQSGGSIWVYSEPGEGTVFKVFFPREGVVEGAPVPAPYLPLSAVGGETVLLVEDEPAVRRIIARLLTEAGYHVRSAVNGSEALAMIRREGGSVDLLLTDVIMPGMSGRELARALSTVRPDMLVIYMSGYTDDSIVRHGVLEPGTHFIGKPFNSAALTRKVREVIDAARLV